MTTTRVICSLTTFLVLANGCAFIARGQVDKYDRRVRGFETLVPDAAALGHGDTKSTEHMLSQFADWTNYIDQQKLPRADQEKLIERMDAAKRRYLLAASQVTDTPDLGYALATIAIDKDDPRALETLRSLSDARATRRQTLFTSTHTYSTVKDGETMMAKTAGVTTYASGKLEGQFERHELQVKPGNCVFATRPFGAEGTPNPGLTFRLTGPHPKVWARCYLSQDLGGLPTRDAELTISVPTLSVRTIQQPNHGGTQKTFDFVLEGNVQAELPFAALTVSLEYEYTNDLIVVWERGAQRLRKQRAIYHLAQSPVFWDRDGHLPAASIARGPSAPTAGTANVN